MVMKKLIRKVMMSKSITKVLMEAGAGAGKTYSLVKEIIKLLSEGRASASEISAITFTNAAASEMKGRIQEQLLCPTDNPNLQNAAEHIDDLAVSTIHSFCNKILSLFPFELGFSLDKNIITEEKDIQKRIDELFESAVGECEEMESVCNEFGIKTRIIKDVFTDMVSSNMDSWKTYEGVDTSSTHLKKVKERCLSLYNEILTLIKESAHKFSDPSLITEILKTETKKLYNASLLNDFTLEEYKLINDEFFNKLRKEVKDTLKFCIYKERFNNPSPLSDEQKKEIKTENVRISEEFIKRDDEIVKWFKEYKNIALKVISDLLIKLVNIANSKKRDMSNITNDETLIYTKELLHKLIEQNVVIPKSLRYKYIFIDEFQDTDPIQVDILNSLGTLITRAESDVTFYFIGDPKQSIYQFRGADLACYLNTSKEISTGRTKDPEHYILDPLSKNFRSNSKMIDYFNRIFEQDRYFEVDSSEFSYTPTSEGKPRDNSIYDNPNVLCGVYRFDIKAVKNNEATKDKKAEALYVASLVKHYVDNEYLIYDKETEGNVRKVQYSDFMIITPTNDHQLFLEAFGNLGIRVNLEGREVPDTMEFRILKGMLKLLSKQNADAEIDRVFLEEVVLSKTIDESRRDEDNQKLNTVYSFLSAYKSEKVGVFLEDFVPFIRTITGNDKAEQVVQIIEMLKESSPSSYSDAYKAICNITQITRRLKLKRDDNAVKIINLHKSKGLQGGICILAGHLSQKVNQGPNIGYMDQQPKQGIFNIYSSNQSLPGGNKSVYLESPYMAKFKETAENDRLMESKRLMYVAATRAKEMLIILNHKKNDSDFNGYWKDLLDQSVPELPIADKIIKDSESTATEELQTEIDEAIKPNYISKKIIEELSVNACDIINPSKLNGINEDKRDYENDSDSTPVQIQNDFVITQPLKGTVIHAMFENTVNRIKSSKNRGKVISYLLEDNDKRDEIIRYVLASTLTKTNAEYDIQKVYKANIRELDKHLKTFLCDSQIMDELQTADEIYTELPFEIATIENTTNKPSSIVRGVMDLVMRFKRDEEVQYQIWDYKTNEKTEENICDFEEALYNKYKPQLELYEKNLYEIALCNGEKINVLPSKIYHLYR